MVAGIERRADTQRPFVDTNVLLCSISADAVKAAIADRVLFSGVVISVQVLNEFAHVARRTYSVAWDSLDTMLGAIRHFADAQPLTVDTHTRGLALARRHALPTYDAMIVAAALQAGCTMLLSEDFQSGQVFERSLAVRNPFETPSP